ncbi:MAG: CBS domain-containing protein [Acidimicrobiales bacterium]|nr:CBS domain-containing protein [Acidimicrobiales bacterium]
MLIAEILRSKGNKVATVRPNDTVERAVSMLKEHGIGALVVSENGSTIDGILSERDIVRALASHAASTLAMPVSQIMTADVVTCHPGSRTGELMAMMTERRIRHIPVVNEGSLVGLVSIGDVVRVRLQELKDEAALLEEYIQHGR